MIDYRGPDCKSPAAGNGLESGAPSASVLPLEQVNNGCLAQALRQKGLDTLAETVLLCGKQYVHLECGKCGKEWDTPWRCDVRVCPRCSRRRAWRLHRKYRKLMTHPNLKHLVLTVPNVAHIRGEHIAWLKACFKKLRRRERYKKAWKGGLCAGHMKHNDDTGHHPHLHILLEGEYVAQAQIMTDWADITGCSEYVWITEAAEPTYVLKDIVKPPPDLSYNPDALLELLAAMAGRRLTYAWGSWYNSDEICDTEPMPCPSCGCLNVRSHGFWLPREGGREPNLIDGSEDIRGPPCREGDKGCLHCQKRPRGLCGGFWGEIKRG